jgi:hypothetical protein
MCISVCVCNVPLSYKSAPGRSRISRHSGTETFEFKRKVNVVYALGVMF